MPFAFIMIIIDTILDEYNDKFQILICGGVFYYKHKLTFVGTDVLGGPQREIKINFHHFAHIKPNIFK